MTDRVFGVGDKAHPDPTVSGGYNYRIIMRIIIRNGDGKGKFGAIKTRVTGNPVNEIDQSSIGKF